jgi:hypothetical protein
MVNGSNTNNSPEPDAPADAGRILVFRASTALQRAALLSGVVRHEGNSMNRWLFPAAFCASLMLLASCSKQQVQPQVVAPANNASPAPQEVKDDTASPNQQVKAVMGPKWGHS